MVKPINELIESIRTRIGDDTSDETLSLLEDVTDTFTDFENKTKDNTNWEQRFNENDKEWRQRYRDRFFNSESSEDEFEESESTVEIKKFEDLFKEG